MSEHMDKTRALAVRCPYCAAEPERLCRTRTSGFDRDWPHRERVVALKASATR